MTPTVLSGKKYTISIEKKFQNKAFLHEQVSVSLDKWETLCILIQYEIELMYTF